MTEYRQITDFHCLLGECPIWDEEQGLLWWTDIQGGVLYTYSPLNGKIDRVVVGKNIGGFALNKKGGVICACLDGLYLWNQKTGFSCIASTFGGKALRFNDCTTDAKGRFLAGTRYTPEKEGAEYELGSLYQVDNSGSISVLDEGIHLSNGLGFSPDNRVLYYTDSLQRVIYEYDYDLDTGAVSNRRVFVKVPNEEGLPDGLAVDRQGFVWSARWMDEHIVRYDPEGTIERRLPSPFRKTTSLAFGGGELTDLYITTAAETEVAGSGDLKGNTVGGFLYHIRLDIQGRIEYRADIKEKDCDDDTAGRNER